VDEVKNEEIQRRMHWVPSRFHQFLGLHRIFALRCAPGTHDVLYGKHVAKETYIEDTLLPDYAGMESKKHEVSCLWWWSCSWSELTIVLT
jgi:hypothetical protein